MGDNYKKVLTEKKQEAESLMTNEQKNACNVAIHAASITAGAAGAIPIPVADALPISGAQITMAIALGKIFDQELSETAAKALIGAAASTLAGRTLVKLVPFAGWLASAGIAAGVTEAIGWSLAVDFAKKEQLKRAAYNNNTDIVDSDENELEEKVWDKEKSLIERAKLYTEESEKDEAFAKLIDEISDFIQTQDIDKESELWSEYSRLLMLV